LLSVSSRRKAPSSPPAAPPAPTSTGDETESIRRTLVLAQRTADAAIKEAEDEAKRSDDGRSRRDPDERTDAHDREELRAGQR